MDHELRANAAGVIVSDVGFGVGDRSGVGDGAGSGVQEASKTPRTPAPAPISSVRRVILIVSQRYRARMDARVRYSLLHRSGARPDSPQTRRIAHGRSASDDPTLPFWRDAHRMES
ncbi:hypothetical protein GCM10009588_02030 [Microbacterium phyllosphaerae]